ncbi:MAG: hypothetical protein LKF31_07850 [Muribaculaceae bacterium]|jgi:hypothetical protein|nr:hypothetical protein [Muribaculaceae bacterium]
MKKTIVLFIMFAAIICASISVNADKSLTRVWSQTGTANLPAGTNYYDQIDNKNISCTFLNKSGTKHFYIQDHTGPKVYDWVINDNAASGTNHVTTTANYTSFSTSRAVTSDETGNLIFTNSYTTSTITAFKILAADAYTAQYTTTNATATLGTNSLSCYCIGKASGNALSSTGSTFYVAQSKAYTTGGTNYAYGWPSTYYYKVVIAKPTTAQASCTVTAIPVTPSTGTIAQRNSSFVFPYTIGSTEHLFQSSIDVATEADKPQHRIFDCTWTDANKTALTATPMALTNRDYNSGLALFKMNGNDYVVYPYKSSTETSTNGNGVAVVNYTAPSTILASADRISGVATPTGGSTWNWMFPVVVNAIETDIYQYVPGECFSKLAYIDDGITHLQAINAGYKALPRAIAKGGSIASEKTTWFDEHFKLIFPKQNFTWTQSIPTGFTVTYALKIGDRTFNGTCVNGTNTLPIYGAYNQTATITFTFKDATNATVYTVDKSVPYNGVTASNGITETSASGLVYKNGHLVCTLSATDGNSEMTSYYVGHRYEEATGSSVTNATYYTLDLTPINSYNIVTKTGMWAAKAFQMTPKMYDLYMSNVTFDAVTGKSTNLSGTIYYLISPHYLFVNVPFLGSEMTDYNINTVSSKDYLKDKAAEGSYLSASVTVSSGSGAPALELENASNSRLKANGPTSTTVFTGAALLNTTDISDVEVKSISATNTTDGYQYRSVQLTKLNNLTPTGIGDVIAPAVSVAGGNGIISVTGADNIVVYTVTGQIAAKSPTSGIIEVPAGLYIVRAGSATAKVIVK